MKEREKRENKTEIQMSTVTIRHAYISHLLQSYKLKCDSHPHNLKHAIYGLVIRIICYRETANNRPVSIYIRLGNSIKRINKDSFQNVPFGIQCRYHN